jgi:hypothetical protein
MFFDEYEHLLGPLALSAVWVIALFSYMFFKDYENKQKEAEARRRHRAQQDREWRRQLQIYPWLRQVIAQHERLERQITLNMLRHNQRRTIRLDVTQLDEVIPVNPLPEKGERVNWKTEGF